MNEGVLSRSETSQKLVLIETRVVAVLPTSSGQGLDAIVGRHKRCENVTW